MSPDDLDLLDREARLAAQTEFHRPLVLEAGAGTGKTAALVARVTSWCLGPGWRRHAPSAEEPALVASRVLERVVAMTFTEAAAAEMAQRVAQALSCLERGELPTGFEPAAFPPDSEERRERARALLAALDRLRVGTIHAFCRRLLATYPLEAGLHPRFTVDADGLALRAVAQELVVRWLRESTAGATPESTLVSLVQEGMEPDGLVEVLAFLVETGVPSAALAAPFATPEAVRALVQRLLERLASFLLAMGEALAGGGRLKKAVEVWDRARALRDTLTAPRRTPWSLEDLQVLVSEELVRAIGGRLEAWTRLDFTQAETGAFGERAESVAAASDTLLRTVKHVAGLQGGRLEAVRQVAARLLPRLTTELRRRGVVAFQGLLNLTCQVLAHSPEVRERERAGLDQVLVDEFQDTDPLQYTIVSSLALDGPRDARPGLFLVGDPKQSIYGWRRADLAAYEAFLNRLVTQDDGQLFRLSRNFRSVPAILDIVEGRLGPLMVPEPGIQPAFQPLIPHRAAPPAPPWEGRTPVEVWLSWRWDHTRAAVEKTTIDQAAELEAAAIARDIRDLHDRHGVPWRDVALLFRAGGRMGRYLQALQGAGIPAVAERDREFYRRREVVEAAALVRCILDPGDTLALVTVLRSAWVGVPDGALLPLWRQGFPGLVATLQGPDPDILVRLDEAVTRAVAAIPADIPGLDRVQGWEASLRHTLRALADLRWAADRESLDSVAERLRMTLLPEATEAARYLGRRRVEGLERFFRTLQAAWAESGGSRSRLLTLLRLARRDELPVAAGAVRIGGEDAVHLLTIHKAKGLDFPVVFLVEQHAGSGAGEEETAAEELPQGWEFRLLGAATPGWDLARERRNQVQSAELVRTLYVAATRPRDRLVLAGAWPRSTRQRPAHRAGSHADLMARAWGHDTDPEALMAESVARRGRISRDGVTWVFPALLPATAMALDPATPPPKGAADLRTGAAALAIARSRARERMVRSWRGTVTAEAHGHQPPWDRGERESGVSLERRLATAVGTAVHAALEAFPLQGDPLDGWRQAADCLARTARQEAPLGLGIQAEESARHFWETFRESSLYGNLVALRPFVIAREVPVLIPPGSQGPVAAVAGTVDLLYRDPDSGALVVADYKTDRIAQEDELVARAAHHAPQLRMYSQALADGLRLDTAPRMELWFLSVDRVVPVASDP